MARGQVTEKEDAELFWSVLGRAVDALEEEDLDYAVFGSVAAVRYGRPEGSEDIDLLVRPSDADRVLGVLGAAGFETDPIDPTWIYKATLDGVLVDIIFRVKGGIYLDEEVLAHRLRHEFDGRAAWLVAPEDSLVIEAVSDEVQAPQHWFNALAILAMTDLDWEYLERRARYAVHRVLSLLLYGQSNDLVVPDAVIRSLFRAIYEV
jgi:hypothetical protein